MTAQPKVMQAAGAIAGQAERTAEVTAPAEIGHTVWGAEVLLYPIFPNIQRAHLRLNKMF